MSATGPDARDQPQDLAQLKRKSLRSGGVTAAAQAVSIVIHLVSTVTLARILTPEEFGVLSMVMAVTVFVRLFRDLGLSAATVQREKLTHDQLSTLYWINVAAGGALTVLLAAAAPLVAWFYDRPELTWVTLALSLTFVIGSFSAQQGALLVRQMRFERAAVANVVGALCVFLVTLFFALRGSSYWSLVYGTLSGGLVTTLLLNSFSGWRPGRPARGTGIRSMLRFGRNLVAQDFVSYFSRNLDNILIGRFVGAEALGLYSRAYSLLMFPLTNLTGPIRTVAFPAMSRLQNRPDDFRNYYRTVIAVLSITSMPLVAYLFVAAEPLVLLALGRQWLPVADLFSILAFAAFLQTPSSFRGTALLSLGMSSRLLRMALVASSVTCTGFVIGIQWGAAGVAIAYATTSLLINYPMHAWAFRGTPLRIRDFYGSIAAPAFSAIVAGLFAYWIRNKYLDNLATYWDAALTLMAFAPVYIGGLLLRAESRRDVQQTIAFVRQALSRSGKAAAPKAGRGKQSETPPSPSSLPAPSEVKPSTSTGAERPSSQPKVESRIL